MAKGNKVDHCSDLLLIYVERDTQLKEIFAVVDGEHLRSGDFAGEDVQNAFYQGWASSEKTTYLFHSTAKENNYMLC